ncbi:LytR/AlgR family response regulator transcription factor [Saccharicrinis sp. 156]|uniref:LytR/AlgR family response regulator transcription factor n=1 Tax=Saccharicrinis sp. 156 TaxID=3417574 RepID=UPI003D34F602
MKPINAIIIYSRSSLKLEQSIQNHSEIAVIKKIKSLECVFAILAIHKVDLLFIDIDNLNKEEINKFQLCLTNNFNFPQLIILSNDTKSWREKLANETILYIPKPLTHARVNHIIKQFHVDRTRNEIKQLFTSCPFSNNGSNRFMVPVVTGYKNIVINEILYIKKDSTNANKVNIYFDAEDKEILSGYISLKQLKNILAKHCFFQTDRNTIMNLFYLREVETKNKNCILTKNGSSIQLPISKIRLKEFRDYCQSQLIH